MEEMLMSKKVTVIEPTQKNETIEESKLRVCAYCRVSSMHEEQLNSFSNQVTHYTQYINNNQNWYFVGIYADEGISGTSKEKRTDFMRLINDCECGLIDLVITKSISRFARNTADCIEVVRKLKEIGIGVFFEKENINTLSEESELVLSILSSIAQEEMISLSKNIRWANQRRYSQGKFQIAPKKFLGYDVDPVKQTLVINPEEAKLVKYIFEQYLSGKGTAVIARELNQKGTPTITNATWQGSTINRMTKNEKYCGDVLMQKTITGDEITFKRKRNKGEQPQYYIKDNHEPIISREDFERAQKLSIERRLAKGLTEDVAQKMQNRYPLTSKIICGKCGCILRRTTQNSGTTYPRVAWDCSSKRRTYGTKCKGGSIHDDSITKLTTVVLRKLYLSLDNLLVPYRNALRNIDKLKDNKEISEYDLQIQQVISQMRILADLSAKGNLTPMLYTAQNNELCAKMDELKKRKQVLADKYFSTIRNLNDTDKIISRLKDTQGVITSLDKELVDAIIDTIIVYSRNNIVFKLKNGIELPEKIGD